MSRNEANQRDHNRRYKMGRRRRGDGFIQNLLTDMDDGTDGKRIAEGIQQQLKEYQVQLPTSPTFLGLGAGKGTTELSLANRLGAHNICLVDKNVTNIPASSLLHPDENIDAIQSDLFSFLEKTANTYDIITLISVEYVIEQLGNFRQFLTLVSKKLNTNGLTLILPAPTLITNFEEFGLENLSGNRTYLLLRKIS